MIYRYATSGTFDSYLWQTVQKKQEFIAQIMSSKSPVRSCEDCDETALSYAEIKALCAGNPLIAEKMNLDNEVAKLRMLKSEYQSQRYRLEDNLLKTYPEQIASYTERIAGVEKDIALYTAEKEKCVDVQTATDGGGASISTHFSPMVINGVTFTEKEPAAKALLEACTGIKTKLNDQPIGEYMGFKLSLRYESFGQQIKLLMRGAMTYQVDLGTDAFGNITRINNGLAELPKMLTNIQGQLKNVERQIEAAKAELEKPFALAAELDEKEARLALLNADLNIDGDGGFDVMNDTETREESSETDFDEPEDDYEEEPRRESVAKSKPSILEGLRNYNGDKSAPDKSKSTELEV